MTADFSCGSSPLARGLPGGARQAPGARGIIPARAGFTPGERVSPCDETDHPRSRGVYKAVADITDTIDGSSPLARGLPLEAVRAEHGDRIIPARAGFTIGTFPYGANDKGSSPLARGLPGGLLVGGGEDGIIPARAGFTRRPQERPQSGEDHPRSRGVYEERRHHHEYDDGSSPLARGLRVRPG